jgi:phosphohistidine phosphatase
MKLYLVQHGEAKSKDEDEKRPLTDQGRLDVERIAAFLKGAGVEAKKVIHSGKLRAEQTAEILKEAIAAKGKLEAHDGINPTDEPGPLAEETSKWTDDVMIVGHLPFMSRMVSLLIMNEAVIPIASYEPGSVVCLEKGEDDTWTICWMVRPELLK